MGWLRLGSLTWSLRIRNGGEEGRTRMNYLPNLTSRDLASYETAGQEGLEWRHAHEERSDAS